MKQFEIGQRVKLINGQTGRIITRCNKPNRNYYLVKLFCENKFVEVFANDMEIDKAGELSDFQEKIILLVQQQAQSMFFNKEKFEVLLKEAYSLVENFNSEEAQKFLNKWQ